MSDDVPTITTITPPSLLRWEPLDETLLREVWASDQAMYPAPELTYGRLKNLIDACPELSICLRRYGQEQPEAARTSSAITASAPESSVYGLIIVWPLPSGSHWHQLLRHEIEEHDVKAVMFPPPAPNNATDGTTATIPIGLHVFHIERFPGFQPVSKDTGFTRVALQEIHRRVEELEKFKSWEIVGYSALVATPEGLSAFTRLGFKSLNDSPEDNRDGSSGSFSARMVVLNGNEPFLPAK